MEYDLIVIGGGSVGAAAGYYSSQAGLKVLIIDQHTPPHTEGSHHGATRIIRHAYGEGEKYVPLVLRAQELWNKLEQESGQSIFKPCGVVNIAPQSSTFIRNACHSAEQYQIPVDVLDAQQIKDRWPMLALPANYQAVYEPKAGYLYCETAISAYLTLAAELGTEFLFNEAVLSLSPLAEGVQVNTQHQSITAKKIVIAAGTWVTQFITGLPVQPVRKVFSWHQSDARFSPEHFPAFTFETEAGEHFYGFPDEDEGLKIGKHQGGQPINTPQERSRFGTHIEDGSDTLAFLRRHMPSIGVCLEGKSCTYDMTPDEDFIIDSLPDLPNALLITGLSGHGFKFASVLGEIASQFALGQESTLPLTAFRLARFTQR